MSIEEGKIDFNNLLMSRIKLTTIIIFLLVIAACVPQSSGSKGRPRKQNASTSISTPTTTPVNSSSIFWYSNLTEYSTILIDSNSKNNIYLKGSNIETFLSNSANYDNQKYCLVIKFNSTTLPQLRIRTLPVSIYGASGLERFFRVEIPEESYNQSTCGGTVSGVSSAFTAFSTSDVCPTCSNVFTAATVEIYKSNGSSISDSSRVIQTGPDSIDLSSLVFKINPQNDSNPTVGVCTSNAFCIQQGYNCCAEGQCINDGEPKPNIPSVGDSNYNEYLVALQEVSANPANYTNYPQFYYLCSGASLPTATPTPTSDPQLAANALLKEMSYEYLCLICDATNGSNPSSSECSATINLVSGESVSFASCDIYNNALVDTYTTVMDTVVEKCGCDLGGASYETNCAGYGLHKTTNSSDLVTSIECTAPNPSADPTPFQVLDVTLNTRTAPHRFFKESDGTAIDNFQTAQSLSPTPVQEGTEFSYADPGTKLIPVNNGNFNMNAILGEFAITLDQALPATVINVEFDDIYVISATSGFYTACPSCAKDSWFNLFSPHPSNIQFGRGLQGIGHSTSRDSGSTNYSYGNYEDTIFGRACWVPPTMIPFTHKVGADVKTQRRDRLKTQAALFANGYQRDWYGFNKGALIGSFNGVSWFAIGKGRKIRATSNKLFLAINAPFADIASPSSMNIHVIRDISGNSVAAQYDYNPDLTWNHPEQTEAASCQMYHQCENDTDCITKLGWEYMCANVSSYRTNWPVFDSDANETTTTNEVAITQILGGEFNSGGTNNRCVYRGAGATCRTDYDSFTGSKRRLFTCAPNFYCASVTSDVFNDQVARYAAPFDELLLNTNHLFGQDAKHLGRPFYYMGDNKDLGATIEGNLQSNADISTLDFAATVGICRPGKSVNSLNPVTQHGAKNNDGTSDFISQIGTCDSSKNHDDGGVSNRLWGCPIIEDDPDSSNFGNYVHITDPTAYGATDLKMLRSQNACGSESRNSSGTSAFNYIEKGPLATLTSNIIEPALAKDACMRRAGSVCHTNLDCFPNKLHADQVAYLGTSYFGGSEAETKFFEEYLVCAQSDPLPLLGQATFNSYDMSKNRCCREIGKDITLYTENDNFAADTILTDTAKQSVKVVTSADNNRYSRYSIVKDYAGTYPEPVIPAALNTIADANQWKTIRETASLTCCGGGFVRKFADGGHDWTNNKRLQLDVTNFKCLNYGNELIKDGAGFSNNVNFAKDQPNFCRSTDPSFDRFKCAQSPYATSDSNDIVNPMPADALLEAGVDDNNVDDTDTVYTWVFSHYNYTHSMLEQIDASGATTFTENNIFNYLTPYKPTLMPGLDVPYFKSDDNANIILEFIIPAYITNGTFGANDIKIVTVNPNDDGSFTPITDSGKAASYNEITCAVNAALNPGAGVCHFTVTATTVKVAFNEALTPLADGVEASVMFRVIPQGILSNPGLVAGNYLYYTTKLARFELLGIPQIAYEPLYCNDGRDKLLPGLFDFPADTRAEMVANGFTDGGAYIADVNYNVGNTAGYMTYADKVKHDPIFSSNEFTCCVELGKSSTSAARCCSNYGEQENQNSPFICKLPSGTDLNVYFNPFVSSESKRSDLSIKFNDLDFDDITGEVKYESNSKLITLGAQFCSSGSTRYGAAFGHYLPEPNIGSYFGDTFEFFSIVDSYSDSQTDSFGDKGFISFANGFRWNHHIYCDSN